MAGGLNPDHFIPTCVVVAEFYRLFEVTPAIAVHGAVEIDRRNAAFVSIENPIHIIFIRYACRALIVNDEVVAFCPIFGFINRKGGIGFFAGIKLDRHFCIESLLDAGFQQFRLGFVVVTATAGDDEHFQSLSFFV